MNKAPAADRFDAHLPQSLRVLGIGQSHLAAIIRAHQLNRKSLPNMRFVLLNRAQFKPPIKDGKLNANLGEAISEASPGLAILAVAGNEHNVLGLIRHPRPFDFVLPQEPDLPLDEEVEILPSGIVANWLGQRLADRSFALMQQIRAILTCPVWALEPPAPQPDEDRIRAHAEPVFRERIDQYGIAPACLRYKLWRLQSAVLQEFCHANGIEFVPIPQGTQDRHGMLAEAFWGNDATHANADFGQRMLDSISHRLAAKSPVRA